MRRREFISIVSGAAAAWPLAAHAQQAPMPMVGFLDARSQDAVRERLRAFRQGLKDNGYAEGENVTITYRFAENQIDRLPALAAVQQATRLELIINMKTAEVLGLTVPLPLFGRADE